MNPMPSKRDNEVVQKSPRSVPQVTQLHFKLTHPWLHQSHPAAREPDAALPSDSDDGAHRSGGDSGAGAHVSHGPVRLGAAVPSAQHDGKECHQRSAQLGGAEAGPRWHG